MGSLATAGPLQARKRRFLESLLELCDVLALQETGGAEVDHLALPPTHRHEGTLYLLWALAPAQQVAR